MPPRQDWREMMQQHAELLERRTGAGVAEWRPVRRPPGTAPDPGSRDRRGRTPGPGSRPGPRSEAYDKLQLLGVLGQQHFAGTGGRRTG